MLRAVRGQLLQVSPKHPYRQARLHRLADQLGYIAHTWPPEHWPLTSMQGYAVPASSDWLTRLAHLPPEAGARHRELLTLIDLLL